MSVSGGKLAQQAGMLMRQEYARPNRLRQFTWSLSRSITGLIGLIIVILTLVTALFAPVIAPQDPTAQNLRSRLTAPAWESGNSTYVLGTDSLGRDVLSRVVFGSRISLLIGTVSVLIGGTLGVMIGLVSGYFGGVVDGVLMRLTDIQLSLPSLVLYLTIMVVLGPGIRNMILGLGITSWVTFARVARSEVLAIKNTQYIEAARSSGQRSVRIMFIHVLPNIMNSVIVLSTLVIGTLILAAAGLSYLGLGVPPTTPDWGGMVADGQDYVQVAWWISTIPGVAIFVVVLGFNLLGDWLRDFLDPRLRRR